MFKDVGGILWSLLDFNGPRSNLKTEINAIEFDKFLAITEPLIARQPHSMNLTHTQMTTASRKNDVAMDGTKIPAMIMISRLFILPRSRASVCSAHPFWGQRFLDKMVCWQASGNHGSAYCSNFKFLATDPHPQGQQHKTRVHFCHGRHQNPSYDHDIPAIHTPAFSRVRLK